MGADFRKVIRLPVFLLSHKVRFSVVRLCDPLDHVIHIGWRVHLPFFIEKDKSGVAVYGKVVLCCSFAHFLLVQQGILHFSKHGDHPIARLRFGLADPVLVAAVYRWFIKNTMIDTDKPLVKITIAPSQAERFTDPHPGPKQYRE